MTNHFYGLPTQAIENKFLRLEFLTEAGPRIVRLMLPGSDENLFAELPQNQVATPFGDYFFRGGHRLWHSPEAMPRTYVPDNAGLKIVEIDGGVRLLQPTETQTGITKSIEIRLDTQRAVATLTHKLQNDGASAVEFAPWAITMLKQGGVAILPQNVGPTDAHGLLSNRNLVLWPYTRVKDARLELNDDVIRIHARAELPPCKIGYFSRRGVIAYWRKDVLFVKRFVPQIDQLHPDSNCNAEVYCNDQFIELETLGPLAHIEPGRSVTHIETWELYSGVKSDPKDFLSEIK